MLSGKVVESVDFLVYLGFAEHLGRSHGPYLAWRLIGNDCKRHGIAQ